MKYLAIALGIVGVVGSLSYAIAIYNIEASKDQAFMVKACVDAGGEWLKASWSQAMECKRPTPRS
jgi:hypothetical protein